MRDRSLSVVVPVFNEAESLAELDVRLREVLDRLGEPAEIILVDDRSSAVSLPEVPLLGVLPGTGGLTRVLERGRGGLKPLSA